jgi:probable rRNA maturation factor
MGKPAEAIQFFFQTSCTLTQRRRLKAFILSLFKKEKKKLAKLHIIFCDDPYLLDLNRQFLKHNYYTDILSFPLSPAGQPLIAEIYISVERVADNALTLKTKKSDELLRVIFHGVLHFCGYKDKTNGEILKMREMENRCLKKYHGKFSL